MDRPIVFALTPRAGRWNHRFLVPPEVHWSQQRLSELVDTARHDVNQTVVASVREVVQPATGRHAPEMVVVNDPRLAGFSRAARNQVQQHVDSYADKLARIVTHDIDWEAAGNALVVERAELSEWLREIDTLLDRIPPGVKNSAAAWWKHPLVLFVGFILLVSIPLVLQRSKEPSPPCCDGEPTTSKSPADGEMAELAKLLGINCGHTAPADCEVEIQRKLNLLFGPENPAGNKYRDDTESSATKVSPERPLTIQEALCALYHVRFGKQSEEEFRHLLSDQGLQATLRKLFPAPEHDFDPFGLLPKDDRATEQLRQIDPVAFRRIASAVAQLMAIDPQNLPQDGTYGEFFRQVAELDHEVFQQAINIQTSRVPQFFTEDNTRLLHELEEGFTIPAMEDLLGDGKPVDDVRFVDIAARMGLAYSNQKSLLSQEAIAQHQRNVKNNLTKERAFQLLGEISHACQSALNSPTKKKNGR